MKDSHVHTSHSRDAVSSMEDYVAAAPHMNVKEITFTEHYDWFANPADDLTSADFAAYFAHGGTVRENSPIGLNFGVEVGINPASLAANRALVQAFPFDFVIASSHIVGGHVLSRDPDFWNGMTRETACHRYWEEMLLCLEMYEDFDVYGHLDGLIRYGGTPTVGVNRTTDGPIIEAILRRLICLDKGLEINTSGFRYGCGAPHPALWIVERYRELGGRLITIGSDAHRAADLAADFERVKQTLRTLGVTELFVYRNREPHAYPI